MKKINLFLIVFLFFLGFRATFAQKNIVYVDKFTGTASIVLPLFEIKNGAAAIPVSLVYNGGGIKVKLPEVPTAFPKSP